MLESNRVKDVVDQLRLMSAADMKKIANFGKVVGYSQHYQDLKDALRTMLVMARNVHGINLDSEFFDLEPILFKGMIPNENFNIERGQMIDIGERLLEQISGQTVTSEIPAQVIPVDQSMAAVANAVNGSIQSVAPVMAPRGRSKIYVSEPGETEIGAAIKQCLASADCDPFETDGPATLSKDYTPAGVIGTMKNCNGAVICLVDPNLKGEKDKEAAKDRLINHVMMELGIALSHFPDRIFFIVDEGLADDVPDMFKDLISYRVTADGMTFSDGQKFVQTFKQQTWNA